MKRFMSIAILRSVSLSIVVAFGATYTLAQPAASDGDRTQTQLKTDVLNKIDQLVERNKELEEQNRQLVDQILVLRKAFGKDVSEATEFTTMKEPGPATASTVPVAELERAITTIPNTSNSSVSAGMPAANAAAGQEQGKWWGAYTPNFGYKVANTERGI